MRSEWLNQSNDIELYELYIKEVKRYPLLKGEEEKRLLHGIHNGSEKDRKKLIQSNLKFVIKVAFMFRNRGLPLMDLINEGNIGLMEAAKRYDINSNVKFISYAVWWVRQAIHRALDQKSRIVKAPKERELKLKSMEEPVYMDGPYSLGDTLVDTSENPFEQTSNNSLKSLISKSLDYLDSRESKIITLYFGLSENVSMSLQEISDFLGLSKERVRQIKEKALLKMRDLKTGHEYLLAA